MRGAKAAVTLGALVGLLAFGFSIVDWLSRTTGLIAAGVGLLSMFLFVLLGSDAPLVEEAASVRNESVQSAAVATYTMVAGGPYSRRDIDEDLHDAIVDGPRGNLLLVSGEPSSGKTRSAWMALQAVRPEALLYNVEEPRFTPRPADGRPIEAARIELDRNAYDVLWLDDVSLHLGRGLTASLLQDFADRGVLVVATVQESVLDSIRETDPELWTELRAKAGVFRMSAELSEDEVDSLDQAYHHLSPSESQFLPSHLAHVDCLCERFGRGVVSHPLGIAYVVAAWLWQSLGMPRHCPAPQLREIVNSLISGRSWAEEFTEAEHRSAIAWATDDPDGAEGLLLRDPSRPDAYRSAGAVAGLAHEMYGAGALIEILSTVVASAHPHDSLAVARATAHFLARVIPTTDSGDHVEEDTLLHELSNALLSQVDRDSS